MHSDVNQQISKERWPHDTLKDRPLIGIINAILIHAFIYITLHYIALHCIALSYTPVVLTWQLCISLLFPASCFTAQHGTRDESHANIFLWLNKSTSELFYVHQKKPLVGQICMKIVWLKDPTSSLYRTRLDPKSPVVSLLIQTFL